MANRPRISSAPAAVRIMQSASTDLKPPKHVPLDKCDRPFWSSVIAEFARAEWTQHQLEIAAMLARVMADLSREQRHLRKEGFVAVRANGTSVENPRSRAVKSMTSDILSLRRSLALHARARSGDSRNDGGRKETGRSLEARFDDDLLPRPALN